MSDYPNSGALFVNDKADNPARPDFTGNLDVEGTEYRIAAWKKTPNAGGKTFLSLKIDLKTEQPAGVAAGSNEADDFDF